MSFARCARMLALPVLLVACTGEAEPPYALWRDGLIVHVRNCEAPASVQTRRRCAELLCQRDVLAQISNAHECNLCHPASYFNGGI